MRGNRRGKVKGREEVGKSEEDQSGERCMGWKEGESKARKVGGRRREERR